MTECRGCDQCRVAYADQRYAEVDGVYYCAGCWKKVGRPWPRRALTDVEIANIEIAARERMLRRGGTDRHLVRSGKS